MDDPGQTVLGQNNLNMGYRCCNCIYIEKVLHELMATSAIGGKKAGVPRRHSSVLIETACDHWRIANYIWPCAIDSDAIAF